MYWISYSKGSLSRRLPQAGARPYVTQIVDVPPHAARYA